MQTVDPLLARRAEFLILEKCTYLISNSLGAMPARARGRLMEYADDWSTHGVVAWEQWLPLVTEVGDLVGKVINAGPGEVLMIQNVSIAESILISALDFSGPRNAIVYDELNFPTIHYNWLAQESRGAEVRLVKSDDGVTIDTQRMLDAIDERTLVVPISHVIFRSSYIQDAKAIVEKAHRVGAMVFLDIFQSFASVPVDVKALGVDAVVGGLLKWGCGGPGNCFLYVRPDLIPTLVPRMVGWFSHKRPFDFDMRGLDMRDDVWRYAGGTPNVPALYAGIAGAEIIAEIGVEAIRERHLRLTARAVERAQAEGLTVNSPLDPLVRGGHVTVDFPGAEGACAELIRRKFIVDYRPGAGIRIAAHFYNTLDEVDAVFDEIRKIVDGR